jgi:O-antigen/teichoic acid export membrane protein
VRRILWCRSFNRSECSRQSRVAASTSTLADEVADAAASIVGSGSTAAPVGESGRRPVFRYAMALGGQAIQAALHLVLLVTMLRFLVPSDYGLFALTIVFGTLASGISNALAATPLSVFTPVVTRNATRSALEAVFAAVNALVVAGAFLIALMTALLLHASMSIAVAMAVVTATWTIRHYTRSLAFARRRPEAAFVGDALYGGLGVLVVAVAWAWRDEPTRVQVALLSLAAAQLLSTQLICRVLGVPIHVRLRSRSLRTYYQRFWSLTRWSLLGVVTTVLQAEAHSFVVTALVGPAAYAPLAAGFVLFGPVRTAVSAWLMVMQPELANAVAEHRRTAVVRTVFGSMIFLAAGTFAVVGLVYLLWAPIDEQLYWGRYDDQPMAFIVAECAMLTLASALIAPLSGLMLALKAFRTLALVTVAGAVVSIFLVLLLLMLATATATLLGVLAAQIFTFVFLLCYVLGRLRQPW